ncbi:GmrSD restriction endonuclease domain-containing protein [Pseudarthrobacter sp. O4]|uniref:GmrSD restriction endonuclease domain-containing protein n=1 Tax=Pseudarthrobacter sp. O4 TaxID=3418417 RepID=UPI003CF19E38
MNSVHSRRVQSHTARRGPGAIDWIACGLAGLLLVSSTACAGPEAAPAAAVGSSAASTSPAAVAAPTTTASDDAPLDPETTPGVALAGTNAPHPQPAYASKALEVLATLPIKGRAPKTGYSRDQFGQAWADVDRNGCDTRNDMLRRDLSAVALKPGTRDCVVLSGILNDPYTSALINFLRGNSTSTAVQIDHVVALSDAWQKGAQQLGPAQRLSFANDPLNLLAVDGPTNLRKSDGDAATWLPPNKSFRCAYVARQISVKSSYALWVTQAEHDAMARVLGDCPGALAPTNQEASPPAAEAPRAAPAAAAVVQAAPAAVYYANCSAVRAAGAAPIRTGQPGYSSKLDRDGDGVACE